MASPNLLGAAFPDFQGDAGVELLKDNLSGNKVAFAEKAQNGQRVSVRSPMDAPDDRDAGDVLAGPQPTPRGLCLIISFQTALLPFGSPCSITL